MDTSVLAQEGFPTGKARALIQFNAITGECTGVLSWVDPTTLNQDHYVYVEVAAFDFSNDTVVGRYPDYDVVDRTTLPTEIFESAMDAIARDKITKRYPAIQQINILSRAIMKLSEQLGVEQTELVELNSYIDEVKRTNAAHKAFYRDSPDFYLVTLTEEQERLAAQMEGGLHELFGPRPAAGGYVFTPPL